MRSGAWRDDQEGARTTAIAMKKVREISRLTYDAGLPSREVARLAGVGSTGVRVMLQCFRALRDGQRI